MAFKAQGVAQYPNPTGRGGFLAYSHESDNLATMRGNAYWNPTISTVTRDGVNNLNGRRSMEDFIRDQEMSSGVGVRIELFSGASSGGGPGTNTAKLSAAGRVEIS